MKELHKIKERLWQELEELARKEDINAGDLEMLHKLTDTVKNIDKICMLEEGDKGYSSRYYPDMRYSRDSGYDRGSSYTNRGEHYVRGHYSREEGRDSIMYRLGEMMEEANDHEREVLRNCMKKLREL